MIRSQYRCVVALTKDASYHYPESAPGPCKTDGSLAPAILSKPAILIPYSQVVDAILNYHIDGEHQDVLGELRNRREPNSAELLGPNILPASVSPQTLVFRILDSISPYVVLLDKTPDTATRVPIHNRFDKLPVSKQAFPRFTLSLQLRPCQSQ